MMNIKDFVNKNPKEIVMQIVKSNNNPILNNLIHMAEKGDYKGIENFARNIFKEQGRNFDEEMMQLQKFIKDFK